MSSLFLFSSVCGSMLWGYIGPGPGLTMLGALIGMVGTLAVALWAVALWPVRAMMRRRREARLHGAASGQVEP